MATIQVDIVSAEGEIHSGTASMVFAPASMGEVGIAPRHAPMLTPLSPGEVRVQDENGNEESFYITGGLLEVQPHLVTVLADTALRGDQLDEGIRLIQILSPFTDPITIVATCNLLNLLGGVVGHSVWVKNNDVSIWLILICTSI